MSRRIILLLILAAACADMGPDKARVEHIGLYACVPALNIYDCTAGAPLDRPPRDGTRFVTTMRAPGAWMVELQLHYPPDLVDAPAESSWVGLREISDTIFTSFWVRCLTCRFLYLKAQVMGPNEKVFDTDSLLWRWP